MSRPSLEVADIFRDFGPAWRQTRAGHLSLGQLKVMSAIERCRSAALGGHVLHCDNCDRSRIAYNSCRNRHCPKCQGSAAQRWLEARQADLLPVEYYHVVFTLPAPISDIAYHNKSVIYNLLFKTASQVHIDTHLLMQMGVSSYRRPFYKNSTVWNVSTDVCSGVLSQQPLDISRFDTPRSHSGHMWSNCAYAYALNFLDLQRLEN